VSFDMRRRIHVCKPQNLNPKPVAWLLCCNCSQTGGCSGEPTDLISVKRDLISVKRDLLQLEGMHACSVKRDLISVKRDLL
jgi:hypothetical protein